MSSSRDAIFAAEMPFAGRVLAGGEPRALLAQAMGECEAGQRVTAAVPGSELPRLGDLLQEAARRLLPLLVRARLDDGHTALHAIADTGACVLLATAAEAPLTHLVARLLAERALLPVVLVVAAGTGEVAALPDAAGELLGDAADLVPSPTPAQQQLFGSDRRRVVRWFDLERPVSRGQAADVALLTLQRAGVAPFFGAPTTALLQRIADDVQRATGKAWAPFTAMGLDKATVAIVGLGDDTAAVAAAVAATSPKPRLGALALHCLRPLPDGWAELLRHKTDVVVLTGADVALGGEPPLLREVRAALARVQADARAAGRPWKDKDVPALHAAVTGLGGAALRPSDLLAFAQQCAEGNAGALVHLGVEFAPLHGKLRKRTVLHESLRRDHPGLETLGLSTEAPAALPAVPAAPLRLPATMAQAPTHDDATRSWDVVAAAAIAGAAAELAPDPYLTAGSAPALTSLFRGNAALPQLPELDAAKCTGCGACWTACPDAALLPDVLGAADLLEAGMRRAGAGGQSAEALRPVLGRLTKALPRSIDTGALTAGAALRHASGAVLAKVDAERRAPMQAAAEALARGLDCLPVALTAPFFHQVEAQRPGAGNLLALALDADACKGCMLCVAACAPQALRPGPRDDAAVQRTRLGAALWRELPDTAGSVIAAARELPEPGLLGALELSRHCLQALAPGDDAEPGSGARAALRTALAVAEAHLQPRLQPHLQQLDELIAEHGKRIRELLAAALPADDLDALHDGLATLGHGAVALSALAARLDQVCSQGRVDAQRLQRLVDTARELADLRWRLATGATGRGRARAGVLLAGAATAFAGRFPWNPFSAPVVLDAGADAGYRALGLLRGQAEAVAADFALLRRARAQLQPGAPGPRRLAFAELTAAERELCPPLWLCADAAALQRGGLQQLGAVLDSGLPIKVLLLQDRVEAAPQLHPALLALAFCDAFVLQSSISRPDHFAAGALAACRHQGPALLHVLAPSPALAGAAPDRALALAEAAVQGRAFPLLRYDPALPGAFGQKLSLDGNPDVGGDGTTDAGLLAAWRTLQELAGVRTPFTQTVEQRAAAAVAAAHAEQMAGLQAQHVSALRAARGEVEAELLSRLQRKLTTLAGGRRA